MNQECPYIDRIDAYHDGELPEQDAAWVAGHVSTCPACADRLRQAREIGGAFAAFAREERMLPIAKERLRRTVAAAVDRASVRFAWELTGIAASVLVAAGIWAASLPASAAAEARTSAWERAAATGGRSIATSSTATDPQQRDAKFASWVVSGLKDDAQGGGDGGDGTPARQQERRP